MRIFLNTLATYGRSVIALLLGLFSTRWILRALGADDFGLYGVVGSIIVFITYLNTTLSGSISRFYAYSIGQGLHKSERDRQNDLRHWFNIAVFIHTTLPLLLAVIGYPLGLYAINHWLVVPHDRIIACMWVFRFALVSAFVTMISVPYIAMFQARQLIMELSLVSIMQTIVNFVFAYKLLTVSCDRLVFYAFYMMATSVLLGLIQIVWAITRFKECKIRFAEMIDAKRMNDFFSFAGAKLFGSTCVILRTQGGCVLLNRFFAPFVNAAYTISVQVSAHTSSLSQSLIGALQPAVVSKAGANDLKGMIRYAISSCRIASFLVMIFIVPLAAEINEVLRLWLGTQPQYAASFCVCALLMLLFDKMSIGYMLAANAYGKKIIVYEVVLGLVLVFALPSAYVCFKFGCSPYYLSICLAATMFCNAIARVLFCSWQLKMSFRTWIKSVFVPVALVSASAYALAVLIRNQIAPSVLRVSFVSMVSLLFVIIAGWFAIFTEAERSFVVSLAAKVTRKMRH